MKYIISILTFIIVLGIIIGTYAYQNRDPVTLPEWNQLPDDTHNQTDTEENNESDVTAIQPVNDDTVTYSLQNEELQITYDAGDKWKKVPIEMDQLFAGEYNGNRQELIDGSYMLTKDYTGFLYAEGSPSDVQNVVFSYTEDQGETWNDSVVTDTFSAMRFRKVEFLNENFGYVIISGGRTMSQEYSIAYLTHDGGETWEATAEAPSTRLIAFGAFVDEETGFLSYGTINPEEPDVYMTQDGGESWSQATFQMPEKYKPVFVQADTPEKSENHLEVLVNQGPNGDYAGGFVKGKFISEDSGSTWVFEEEVDPDGEEQDY